MMINQVINIIPFIKITFVTKVILTEKAEYLKCKNFS